jgi:hypothetical protein
MSKFNYVVWLVLILLFLMVRPSRGSEVLLTMEHEIMAGKPAPGMLFFPNSSGRPLIVVEFYFAGKLIKSCPLPESRVLSFDLDGLEPGKNELLIVLRCGLEFVGSIGRTLVVSRWYESGWIALSFTHGPAIIIAAIIFLLQSWISGAYEKRKWRRRFQMALAIWRDGVFESVRRNEARIEMPDWIAGNESPEWIAICCTGHYFRMIESLRLLLDKYNNKLLLKSEFTDALKTALSEVVPSFRITP